MLMKLGGLGLIPDWQFSMDPTVNPKINPFVKYPSGVFQTTPQPLYPYYQGPELQGLGIDNPFDSFWWKNRKPIVIGTLALLGLAIVGGASAILK